MVSGFPRAPAYTIYSTTRIPGCKLHPTEFLSLWMFLCMHFSARYFRAPLRYRTDGWSFRTRREVLEEVGGCLQLLDLRSERTSHCVDSEEAGNSRTHQMLGNQSEIGCRSRNILDKNSYLGQFAHGCESLCHKSSRHVHEVSHLVQLTESCADTSGQL